MNKHKIELLNNTRNYQNCQVRIAFIGLKLSYGNEMWLLKFKILDILLS